MQLQGCAVGHHPAPHAIPTRERDCHGPPRAIEEARAVEDLLADMEVAPPAGNMPRNLSNCSPKAVATTEAASVGGKSRQRNLGCKEGGGPASRKEPDSGNHQDHAMWVP